MPERPSAGLTEREPLAFEVLATVSHELRSPLTSIKGYARLMLQRWESLDDDQKRTMLAQIDRDADRVVRLMTELLDVSRLETDRLTLRLELVDLPAVAEAVVARVGAEYPELEATIRFDPEVTKVWADPDKVGQVLTNLVENACKYADPRGLVILGTQLSASVAVVAVTDCGPGIPPEDLPQVFTKFFRRSESKPSGSGLGLWISRRLVEAHGGTLTVDSPPGHGASFRLTLPMVDLEGLQG